MSATAKFYVSVNGGANQDGGIDLPSGGAVVRFVPFSTNGWLRARWEIYDYPEGFSTPTGWVLAGDGTIFYEGFDPPQFTIPSASELWGVYMLRLLVNEQVTDDTARRPDLLDDGNALSMLSPRGIRGIGAREAQHFTTPSTRVKGWLRSLQRTLRTLEAPGFSAETTGTTARPLQRYPLANGDVRAIRAIVVCRSADGTRRGEFEVKALYKKLSGLLSVDYAPIITPVFRTDAGLTVSFSPEGNDAVLLTVAGLSGVTISWRGSDLFL